MAKYVVGLDGFGHRLLASIQVYCHQTKHQVVPERTKNIFDQCVGQMLGCMDSDFQAYLANLMAAPDWRTIWYHEHAVNYSEVEWFKNEFRVIGILLWHKCKAVGILDERCVYLLESGTPDFIVIGCYVDNHHL